MKARLPESINPFVDKTIVAIGNRIAYRHEGKIYDAISGQGFLFSFIEKTEIEYLAQQDIKRRLPNEYKNIIKNKIDRPSLKAKKKIFFGQIQ